MKAALQRFLTFRAENVVVEVYWALGLIYVALLVICLLSIGSGALTPQQRTMWRGCVLFLPIVGMGSYCIFSLLRADYSFLRSVGLVRNKS